MSASTQTIKAREPQPAPQPSPATEKPTPPKTPVATYWGDRFLFLFWLACFALMVLMNVFDTLASLFRK